MVTLMGGSISGAIRAADFIDLRDREGIVRSSSTKRRTPNRTRAQKSFETTRDRGRRQVVMRDKEKINRTSIRPDRSKGPELYILNDAKRRPSNWTRASKRRSAAEVSLPRPAPREDANNIKLRHRAALAVRRFMDEHGFYEIETPMLIRLPPKALATMLSQAVLRRVISTRCRSRRRFSNSF